MAYIEKLFNNDFRFYDHSSLELIVIVREQIVRKNGVDYKYLKDKAVIVGNLPYKADVCDKLAIHNVPYIAIDSLKISSNLGIISSINRINIIEWLNVIKDWFPGFPIKKLMFTNVLSTDALVAVKSKDGQHGSKINVLKITMRQYRISFSVIAGIGMRIDRHNISEDFLRELKDETVKLNKYSDFLECAFDYKYIFGLAMKETADLELFKHIASSKIGKLLKVYYINNILTM